MLNYSPVYVSQRQLYDDAGLESMLPGEAGAGLSSTSPLLPETSSLYCEQC